MQSVQILGALITALLALASAQQQPIFYPALKVHQIPVNLNGRIGLIGTTIDLATPLPATRDAQGRQVVTRQTAGGQQPQRPGAQPRQQVRGVQFPPRFRVVTPPPPQQQQQQQQQPPQQQQLQRGQKLQRNGGQQAQRVGGPQPQQLRVQPFAQVRQYQQFNGRQFQQSNAAQRIQHLNRPQFRGVGVQTFGQVQQLQQFTGQQFQQINRPQFGGAAVVNGRQINVQTLRQPAVGGYAHQVWEPSNW